jgi:hypothetical protein
MRPVTWHVEFEPTVANIQRLKFQASANAEENNFTAKTNNGNLELILVIIAVTQVILRFKQV